MDREDLRLTKVKAFYNGEEVIQFNQEKNGYFHRWADDAFTDNTGKYFQRVVGIIETEDGYIYKVPPEDIILLPKKTLLGKVQEAVDKRYSKK